ncbi:MAG TPA: GNAT family N-acetyltransferase [Terracidiphilus sp.]|nr:GNAT family N-acetyltransferase [Terracidiphilus sp.]
MRKLDAGEANVERLNSNHDRASFHCGNADLDRYLQQQAGQDARRKLAAVYVLTFDGRAIGGYYTLSSTLVEPTGISDDLSKKLPRNSVPATLLGRMAIGQPAQGRGWGEYLLLHALRTALHASATIASWALIVDAKPHARAFYQKYSFIPMLYPPGQLLLPMRAIAVLFPDESS